MNLPKPICTKQAPISIILGGEEKKGGVVVKPIGEFLIMGGLRECWKVLGAVFCIQMKGIRCEAGFLGQT